MTTPIERLTVGSTITVKDAAWGRMSYVVIGTEFDGYGYLVTYGTEAALTDERGWNDSIYVEAGGSVDAEGDLRTDADITADEWTAKADAIDADILQLQGKLNTAHGYVAQPIDEARRAQFFDAVAKALGVDARESEAA